jgi:hypothetical protein
MLEYIAKAMIQLEESKTYPRTTYAITREAAYNLGLQDAQNILLKVYDFFAPKKLSETHYLIDKDLEYN